MDRQHSLTTHFVSIVSAVNIHESTTCTTRTNRPTTIWGQFSQSGEKLVSLMTFMDRQHTLTTRFVSMISVMNIHGSTNRTARDYIRRLVRIVRLVNALDDLYQPVVLDNPRWIICVCSYVKCLKWSESFSVFHFGFNFLMKSISKIKQSNLYLHFFNTEKKMYVIQWEKIFLSSTLVSYGYPSSLVWREKKNKQNKKKLKKNKTPTASTEIPTELRSTAVLPYVSGLSEQIRRKDAVDLAKQDRVVYRIPCECRKIYIGETGRPMQERISEHAHNTG